MAWTTPSTATAGSTALTAAFWNEQVRDNSDYLKTEADAVGMVLLDDHSFTTQGTIDRVGVFTSAYEAYQIHIVITALSPSINLGMRLLSGSTAATSNYVGGAIFVTYSTGVVTGVSLSTTHVDLSANTAGDMAIVDVVNPNVAARTFFSNRVTQSTAFGGLSNVQHTAATAYNGFRLVGISGSPTFTGTVRTYGFRA
jgi:hypothetical protein